MNSKIIQPQVLVFLTALMLLYSCHSKNAEDSTINNQPSIFNITDVQLNQIAIDTAKKVREDSELILTGKVSFDEDKVAKVYPLVSGNVEKVNVSLGDYVKKGNVMAVLRSADISGFQNQYLVAKSNMEVAKKTLDIAQELYKSNVNSEKDFMNAQNEFRKAEAEKNHLNQQLSIYGATENEVDAEYRVLAPIEGFVVEKNISENMEIRSDNAGNIFTVSSLNTVWVLADVYESDLSKVKLGDEIEMTTIAYENKIFKGKIDQIANLLNPITKTLTIRIVMDNHDGLLKPEMFATIKVHISTPQTIVSVPSSSLIFDNNRFYVMVRKSKNQFEKREVQPGAHLSDLTYINRGVQAGELVITEGSLLAISNKF